MTKSAVSRHSWGAVFAFTLAVFAPTPFAMANSDGPLSIVAAGDPDPATPDMTAGYQAVESGDYASAIVFFETLLIDHPANAEAYNQLGYINRRLQNFDQAFALYSRALELDPAHTGAHNYVGESYLEVGDLAKAEYHLSQLDLLCLFGCQDYSELAQAVALYKANYQR